MPMRKLCTLASTLALAASFGWPAQAVETGQAAPEFDLPGRTTSLKLSDFKGKTVYLDFWASWCGPCKQSFPWMNDMQSRYGAKGLRIVGINVDAKTDEAKTFLADNAAKFDVAFDAAGKTPRSYAIKGMPTSVLIGPDGKVLMVHTGFKDDNRAELEQQIKHALSLKD
jgi:cytochrome c biogenesis protein CcmG, thiol:disulfide interchange protein DsbE